MATSLRDIPGANRARKRRKAERGLWAPPRPTTLDITPGGLRLERTKAPRRFNRPARQVDLFLILLVVGAIAWACGSSWPSGAPPGCTSTAPGSTTAAPSRPDAAEELDIRITLASSDELYRSDLKIDGVSVLEDLEPEADGRTLRIRPADAGGERAGGAGPRRGRAPHRALGRSHVPRRRHLHAGATSSTASPPTLDVPASLPPVPIDEPVTIEGEVEEGVELRLDDEPIDNDDGSFAVDFDSPPTGSLAVRGDRRSRQPHAQARGGAGRLPGDVPRRARERGGVGRRRAARRHRGSHRPRPHRHRRARPQGRVRHRRLRLRAGQGPGDRRRHRRLRPVRDRRVPRGQGHPGDRAAGRVPRSDLRPRGVGGRATATRSSRRPSGDMFSHLRRVHQLLPRGGACLQPGHRPRGRVDGREGHPLGLHPPSGGRPGRRW